MAIERPGRHSVAVDVETLGGTAATFDTVRGLRGWGGDKNIGVSFGNDSTFGEAQGLGEAHDKAMRLAWNVVNAVEKVSGRYADALAGAAELYGDTDTHSAGAVRAAARGMATTRDPKAT